MSSFLLCISNQVKGYFILYPPYDWSSNWSLPFQYFLEQFHSFFDLLKWAFELSYWIALQNTISTLQVSTVLKL